MDIAALTFAFSAGMLASVNPCGFAMLPTFITYYLSGSPDSPDVELSDRLLRAFGFGWLMTSGFLLVFVTVGLVLSAGGHVFIQLSPIIGLVVGIALIALGGGSLLGKTLILPVPIFDRDFKVHGGYGMFLYGIAYAALSLNCTLPIFLSVFAGSLVANSWWDGSLLFWAYSLGMGTVITTLALATALFQNTIIHYLRRLMPHIKTLSAAALILSGSYLIYYQLVRSPFFNW